MITQRSLFASVFSFGLGCAPLVAPTTAFAADTKIVPAYVCLPSGTNYFSGDDGSVSNNSSSIALTLRCPIVRDNTTAKPTSVKVSVKDNGASTGVICRVRTSALAASGIFSGADVTSSGTGIKILTLPIPTTMPANALYLVSCTIPAIPSGEPSSSVRGIIYEEL